MKREFLVTLKRKFRFQKSRCKTIFYPNEHYKCVELTDEYGEEREVKQYLISGVVFDKEMFENLFVRYTVLY